MISKIYYFLFLLLILLILSPILSLSFQFSPQTNKIKMDIQNFIVQRRSSARRNISGESNISSLSNSPTTDSFSSGSSEHLDGFKLSSDYEQAWKEHQSKARAEGITLANGNYITRKLIIFFKLQSIQL